jgi:hypothetical protein
MEKNFAPQTDSSGVSLLLFELKFLCGLGDLCGQTVSSFGLSNSALPGEVHSPKAGLFF